MSKNYNQRALILHKKHKGKLGIHSLLPLSTKADLSVLYTPGVASVSELIGKDRRLARAYTMNGRMIAVISDGSAILGLGNLGPEAALPVMEGKCLLFKQFADVDAFPLVLGTQDTEEIIRIIKAVAPSFAGINLEDISAPRCFEIEERLRDELAIPVFHDDQHGTAIVVLAGLINALRVVKKDIRKIRLVINGAGAAGSAVYRLLVRAGVKRETVYMLDSKGILHPDRGGIRGYKREIAQETNRERITGGLAEALRGADVFIGMSVADVLTPQMVETMAEKSIVFALANPNPEIAYAVAKKTSIAVLGTGRSDYPNQINNVLAFPGVFRGVLDAGATMITEEMKLAAGEAIASLVSRKDLSSEYIIPEPFDERVARKVATAVRGAWKTRSK